MTGKGRSESHLNNLLKLSSYIETRGYFSMRSWTMPKHQIEIINTYQFVNGDNPVMVDLPPC